MRNWDIEIEDTKGDRVTISFKDIVNHLDPRDLIKELGEDVFLNQIDISYIPDFYGHKELVDEVLSCKKITEVIPIVDIIELVTPDELLKYIKIEDIFYYLHYNDNLSKSELVKMLNITIDNLNS